MATPYETDKQELGHHESVELDKHRAEMIVGAHDALSEGRSPWKVMFENKKVLLLILAVQVGSGTSPLTAE